MSQEFEFTIGKDKSVTVEFRKPGRRKGCRHRIDWAKFVQVVRLVDKTILEGTAAGMEATEAAGGVVIDPTPDKPN